VGLWRTKTLRQIGGTAAYFRDGQAATLDDVIEFYGRGGLSRWGPKEIRPLNVSSEEKQWLIKGISRNGDGYRPNIYATSIIHSS